MLVAGFLCALATGFVAAHVNLDLTTAGLDGRPGLSMDDVIAAYHGRPGRTRLTAKIDGGTMERYVPRPADKEVLLAWSAAGAPEAGFAAPAAVLDRLCVRCHHPGGEMAQVPFAPSRAEGPSFELVSAVTVPDQGKSIQSLAQLSHIHLFGMGMLFTLAGLAFLGTDTSARTKGIVVALPFVAMFLDIGCWWLTHVSPVFAPGVMAGGGLMALAVAILIVRPLWELLTPGRGGPGRAS